MSATFWLRTGAIWGFLAIAFGAMGAHMLESRFESLGHTPGGMTTARIKENFHTASQYQMYCALAIVGVGLMSAAGRGSGVCRNAAGWLLFLGSLGFSGSLYVLCVTGDRWYGRITPFGGVAMMAGWIAMAVAAGASSKKASGEALS